MGYAEMVKYENECVDCGKPCLGTACPNRRVKHLYCDYCNQEVNTLYEFGQYDEICGECLLKEFEVISVDD